MHTTRRQFMGHMGSAAALGMLAPWSALAQTLDQVKIFYGFPAGSAGDSVARRVGEKLAGSPYTRNAAVVENKPGAGGRIALEVLKGAPSGARAWASLLPLPQGKGNRHGDTAAAVLATQLQLTTELLDQLPHQS